MMAFWNSAGWMALLLVVLGLAALAVFLLRLMDLRRAHVDYADFFHGVANVFEQGNADEALAICDETRAPVARVVATAIRHRSGSARALRETVDAAGRAEVNRLERRFAFLAVVAQIAPLLGLLGTLVGFLKALLALDGGAVVARAELLGAAVPALGAAAFGLVVAIAAHVMYGVLQERLDRVAVDMEAAASEILALIAQTAAHAAEREAAHG